jgi:hypothetical protein
MLAAPSLTRWIAAGPEKHRHLRGRRLEHVLDDNGKVRLAFRHEEDTRHISIDAQTIQWRSDAPCTSDIAKFEEALAGGDVRQAIDLYRGDLLPICYDDWIASKREHFRAIRN